MPPCQNILLIRLKAIGDIVLTLPAVQTIRDNFPTAKITFLTSKENGLLLRGFRAVDEVILLDRATLRQGNPFRIVPECWGLVRRLRAGKFSLVVDFQGYGETAWLARLTSAPQRWGLDCPGYGWIYTRQITQVQPAHPAEVHRDRLKQCGLSVGTVRNEFVLPETVVNDARRWFTDHRLDPTKPILYVQPFTSALHKNWPLEKYLTVARHWLQLGMQIILGGGPADGAALEPARREGFVVSTGGSLLATAGIIQLSTLVLGGDTGTLHMAVAQGKRVLMLMSQVTLGCAVPFQHPDWVVVSPRPGAIAEITVAEVNDTLARFFNAPAGNASC